MTCHVHVDAVDWEPQRDLGAGAARAKGLLDLRRAGSKEFVFGVAELPEGASLPLHTTRQAELHYVLGGRSRVRMGPARVELSARACVYIPGDLPRAVESPGPGPLRYLYTYACERLGQAIVRTPIAEARAAAAPSPGKTWLMWDETEPWQPIEPSKGMRLRFRRVMDRQRKVAVIAGVAEIEPGLHYTRHIHDQPEVYYVLGGAGIVYVGTTEIAVHPGSALYIGSRVPHGADSLGDMPLTIFYVYGCEAAGHEINWTAVEEIYTEVRRR